MIGSDLSSAMKDCESSNKSAEEFGNLSELNHLSEDEQQYGLKIVDRLTFH